MVGATPAGRPEMNARYEWLPRGVLTTIRRTLAWAESRRSGAVHRSLLQCRLSRHELEIAASGVIQPRTSEAGRGASVFVRPAARVVAVRPMFLRRA